MMISAQGIKVFDETLRTGTPLAFEIVGGRRPHTLRGVVFIGTRTELDLDPGYDYEVRLIHPVLGRLIKVLRVGENETTVYFNDMRIAKDPRPRLLRWPRLRPQVSFWSGIRPAVWRLLPKRATPKRVGDRSWVVEDVGGADVVHLSKGDVAVSARVPPGTERIEMTEDANGYLVARPRTQDLRIESMLDYMMRGYAAEAGVVREGDTAEDLLSQAGPDSSRAAIAAYYLLRTGEAEGELSRLRELATFVERLPDLGIILAQALLAHGDSSAASDEAWDVLARALGAGIPAYLEGFRLLRSGLLALWERAADGNSSATTTIAMYRGFQSVLRYNSAVASWPCGATPAPAAVSIPLTPA